MNECINALIIISEICAFTGGIFGFLVGVFADSHREIVISPITGLVCGFVGSVLGGIVGFSTPILIPFIIYIVYYNDKN